MSRASSGRRERRLTKKKLLGRPTGTHVSLFKDRQRFAIAAWIALAPDLGTLTTARLVTVLIEEDTPIRIEDVEGLRLLISAPFKPPALKAAFGVDDAARQLQQKAKLIRGRATGSEMQWIETSASALRLLVYFFVRDDVPGMRRSLDILRQAGWGKTSARIGRRLEAALKSNIPPRDDPVGPAIRRALDALRQERSSQPIDTT
jgi:hypothetical protein